MPPNVSSIMHISLMRPNLPIGYHHQHPFHDRPPPESPEQYTNRLRKAREEQERAAERREREELRQEWLRKQEELKQEDMEITYSYWDGSGHRKSVMVSLRLHLCARWA